MTPIADEVVLAALEMVLEASIGLNADHELIFKKRGMAVMRGILEAQRDQTEKEVSK